MQICLLCRGTCCVVKPAQRLFTKSASDSRRLRTGTGGVPCACVLSVTKLISRCRPYLPPSSKYGHGLHSQYLLHAAHFIVFFLVSLGFFACLLLPHFNHILHGLLHPCNHFSTYCVSQVSPSAARNSIESRPPMSWFNTELIQDCVISYCLYCFSRRLPVSLLTVQVKLA